MSSRTSYPAAARLHRPAEFAAAMKGGRRLGRGNLFALSASRPGDAAETQEARLGLIIAKRFAPLAVTRNACKRVIREAFRARRHELPAGNYVVRLHAKIAPCSLTALKKLARAEADAHFRRALRC